VHGVRVGLGAEIVDSLDEGEEGTLVNTESERRQPEQPSGPPGGTGPVDPTKDPDWLDDKKPRQEDDTPETAEPPEAEELSENVPDKASGEGDTPLGSTDQHSDAPGPHGTG
jgi:hypothetical protein